ncbi:hypothetical protein [Sinosporangium siamense]|uniref:Uncharacterized protein n=1 Tax=Sinosporangium siamense TaxID=1367973 RepID=A0A919REJ7_9ACTN|nr:hypothetical protein [Sinosporangium siamense]GII92440.1 hypothetical protein Ssi02_26710 [Sinosporangium siamense]
MRENRLSWATTLLLFAALMFLVSAGVLFVNIAASFGGADVIFGLDAAGISALISAGAAAISSIVAW